MRHNSPHLTDLVLAYRQAKTALAFEAGNSSRGEIADFELDLPVRCLRLQQLMRAGRWFDRLPLGRMVVMPKSSSRVEQASDGVVRVGHLQRAAHNLEVRLQLEPSPEFAIAEVLYLWRFGPALESLLGDECLGYRLSRVASDGRMDPYGHEVYERWQTSFARYREEPVKEARRLLGEGDCVLVLSTDISSFFDRIDPSFLLSAEFIAQLHAAARRRGRTLVVAEYRLATRSLLRRYADFREQRRQVGGHTVDTNVGIPIGSLISRLFANVALHPLDEHIKATANVVLYRRYVDDIVVVARNPADPAAIHTQEQAIARFFPQVAHRGGRVRFTVPGVGLTFEIQQAKTRVHDLRGPAAIDFLGAIQQSFAVVASERRALLGDIEKLDGHLDGVELFGDTAALDRLPRLRDADRFTLRRYMATAFVQSLDRCARLLSPNEAGRLLRSKTRRMRVVIDGGGSVDDIDLMLRLLQVALVAACDDVASELTKLITRRIKSLSSAAIRSIKWRGTELASAKATAAMTKYLERLLHETRASAVRLKRSARTAEDRLARRLRECDLRYLDRENDIAKSTYAAERHATLFQYDGRRLSRTLSVRQAMSRRLDVIRKFIDQSRELGESTWSGATEVSLFLSVKPPTFLDVARRWLARPRNLKHLGRLIPDTVNALRGTRYSASSSAPVFANRGAARMLTLPDAAIPNRARVILANLSVGDDAFEAAAQGTPLLTARRLRELDAVLREAMKAVDVARRQDMNSVLILPELAVPTSWARDLAEFATRRGVHLIAGLEYHHTPRGLVNQALGVFPGDYAMGYVTRWTKGNPARGEEARLNEMSPPKRFAVSRERRLIVASRVGEITVLVCSELLETGLLRTVGGLAQLIAVPAWNDDIGAFDHLSNAAASLLLHAFVCIANNAEASDSRIVTPISNPRFEREWCRVVHRNENRVIWADLPVAELTAVHKSPPVNPRRLAPVARVFRPLPPGWRNRT